MRCWVCGIENLTAAACAFCGAALAPAAAHGASTCAHCGATLAASQRFCRRCGTRARDANPLPERRLEGQDSPVNDIAFSPDGRLLAAGCDDGTVWLREVASGQEVRRWRAALSVWNLSFSADGALLITAGEAPCARLWEVTSGREAGFLEAPIGWPSYVVCSPSGKPLAAGTLPEGVRVWDLAGGEWWDLRERQSGTSAMAFSPGGSMLAEADQEGRVLLWNVFDRRVVQRLEGGARAAECLTFSPDGRLLASAGGEKTVRMWEVGTGREARRLSGHAGYVRTVAFSPDGRLLASGGNDKTVRLWEVRGGREARWWLGSDSGPVACVAFSPTGRLLASAGVYETVRLWELGER